MSDDQDGLVASLNETIRDIHALGRTAPATTFKARALELVECAIAFDSAMWGTGPAAAKTLHDVYLHRQPSRIVDAYTAGFRSEDLLRNAAYAKPGTTVDLFDLIEPRPGARHGSIATSRVRSASSARFAPHRSIVLRA